MFFSVESFKLKSKYIIILRGRSVSGQAFANTVLEFDGSVRNVGNGVTTTEFENWLEGEFRNLFGISPFSQKEIKEKLLKKSHFVNYDL